MRNKQIEQIVYKSYDTQRERDSMLRLLLDKGGKPSMKEMSKMWQWNRLMIKELKDSGAKKEIEISEMSYGQREAFISKYGLDTFIRYSKAGGGVVEFDIAKELEEENGRLLTLMAYEGRSAAVEQELKALNNKIIATMNSYEGGKFI